MAFKKSETIRSYKNMVLDWEEYMDNTEEMNELRKMSGSEAVKTIKKIWEDIKSIR